MVPEPGASTSAGSWLEMYILRFHFRLIESKSLELGIGESILRSAPSNSYKYSGR